jgi:hypothetical protein
VAGVEGENSEDGCGLDIGDRGIFLFFYFSQEHDISDRVDFLERGDQQSA